MTVPAGSKVKDPTALAWAIERIAGDEGLCREFGRRSREKAEEEFDDRQVARQVLSALGVLGDPGGAGGPSR